MLLPLENVKSILTDAMDPIMLSHWLGNGYGGKQVGVGRGVRGYVSCAGEASSLRSPTCVQNTVAHAGSGARARAAGVDAGVR